MQTSFFHNMYIAFSITRQGRTSISSAIILFESLLANNINFMSFDEIVEFINNVINEKRTYNDSVVLDMDIDILDVFEKLVYSCGYGGYIPTYEELDTLMNILRGLSQEDLNRLFYKNNLYNFCENKSVSRVLEYMFERLETPYLDPAKVPEEIEVELEEFKNMCIMDTCGMINLKE